MDGLVYGRSGLDAGGDARALGAGDGRSARLARLVRQEIIPRLVHARRGDAAPRRPAAAHVETLARLALARDPAAAGAQIAALRDSGVAHDALMDDLVAPAARLLGDLWTRDAADFVEVALGTGRLCAAVRQIGNQLEPGFGAATGPLALIATPGAERHGLGAMIVAQTFRLAGWRVREAPGAEPERLAAMAAAAPYDLIGLSVSTLDRADETAALVARLRRATRNRRAVIALGGAGVRADPGAARALGADFGAGDAREALAQAQRHLSDRMGAVNKG